MKNKLLYKFGLLCGIVPLAGGIFIFITWWMARAFFAVDLDKFTEYGFLWIFISLIIALIGLTLLILFLSRNYPVYRKQVYGGVGLILSNIPVVLLILMLYSSIAEKAYVKIYNNSNADQIELILKSATFERNLGYLDHNKSTVGSFIPHYPHGPGHDSFPEIDSVTLVIKENQRVHYVTMPRVDRNDCRRLVLDSKFHLKTVWE
jgi:uncharacterized membrane protein